MRGGGKCVVFETIRRRFQSLECDFKIFLYISAEKFDEMHHNNSSLNTALYY